MSNIIHLTIATDKKEKGTAFYLNNINRLIMQCTNGENSFSYMGVFSFLEAYLRARFSSVFAFSKTNKIQFPEMMTSFKYYITDYGKKNNELGLIIVDLKTKYHYWDETNWTSSTNTDANHIRHTFSDVKRGELYWLLCKTRDFFKLQNIETSYFDTLLNSITIIEDKKDGGYLKFYTGSMESFFDNYNSFSKYIENKEFFDNSLRSFINCHAQNIKDLTKIYNEYIAHIDSFNRKEEYLFCLKNSLDQEITSRYLKHEINPNLKLSDFQKKIVDTCYSELYDNRKNILVEGTPGSGKTLVLIAAAFKLNKSHAKQDPILLTFSGSLKEYNKHCFELFNKDCSKQLNIPQYTNDDIKIFIDNHVFSFDIWMKEKFNKMGINIFSLEKYKGIDSLKLKAKDSKKISLKTFELAVGDIWPNLKDPTAEVQKLNDVLDQQKEIPDLYAYYKFARENKTTTQYSNDAKADYIFIDEVQDLNKAQYETAKKLSKYGSLLAGDINQKIRSNSLSWKDLGINKEDIIPLTENYRMSLNIQLFGINYLKSIDSNIEFEIKNPVEIGGPAPQLYIAKEDSDESINNTCKQVISCIKMLSTFCKINYNDIFIVVPTRQEIKSIKQEISLEFSYNEIEIQDLTDSNNISFDNKKKINIGTIESIKGFDCPVVLFLLNRNIAKEVSSTASIPNKLYTVINRAMHLLMVFTTEDMAHKSTYIIDNFLKLLKTTKYKEEELPSNWYLFEPITVKDSSLIGFISKNGVHHNLNGSILSNKLKRNLNLSISDALNKKLIVSIIDIKEDEIYLEPEYIAEL